MLLTSSGNLILSINVGSVSLICVNNIFHKSTTSFSFCSSILVSRSSRSLRSSSVSCLPKASANSSAKAFCFFCLSFLITLVTASLNWANSLSWCSITSPKSVSLLGDDGLLLALPIPWDFNFLASSIPLILIEPFLSICFFNSPNAFFWSSIILPKFFLSCNALGTSLVPTLLGNLPVRLINVFLDF